MIEFTWALLILVRGDPSRGNLELPFNVEKQISENKWDDVNEGGKLLNPYVLSLVCNPGHINGIPRYTVQRPSWGI